MEEFKVFLIQIGFWQAGIVSLTLEGNKKYFPPGLVPICKWSLLATTAEATKCGFTGEKN